MDHGSVDISSILNSNHIAAIIFCMDVLNTSQNKVCSQNIAAM